MIVSYTIRLQSVALQSKILLGPVYLVAKMAVFNDYLHDFYFRQVMNDSLFSGGMDGVRSKNIRFLCKFFYYICE